MILLECLYAQSHVSSPHQLPHTCLSQMRVKLQFSKQKLFVLENLLPRFGKHIGLPSEANLLDNLPKQFMGPSDVNCWTISQHNSPENLPLKFLSQTFFYLFSFMSCTRSKYSRVPQCIRNALCQSQQLIRIYKTCIY